MQNSFPNLGETSTAGTVVRALAIALVGLALVSPLTLAQNPDDAMRNPPIADTRADQAAEETVSLSAVQIIEILRREPGLLLAVKKALVREAYGQGRVLESADLQDEALYGRLREDENMRVLATREIEERKYIRAKPSPEEEKTLEKLERESGRVALAGLPSNPESSLGAISGDTLGRQEDIYWKNHDSSQRELRGTDPETTPALPRQPNERTPQEFWPENPVQEQALGRDNLAPDGFLADRPEPERTQLDGSQIDANTLERIGPPRPDTSVGISLSGADAGTGEMSRVALPQAPQGWSPLENAASISSDVSAGNSSFEASATGPEKPLHMDGARLRSLSPYESNASSHRNPEQDRTVIRHRANPYANVPSLYDLYTQVAGRSPVLERFGMTVFRNRNGNLDSLPMDLPVGPDYVLGPGDSLNIQLSGSVAQRLARVVDPEGRVALPEVGAIEVAGRNLGDAQRLLQATLRTEFHDVRADLALGRIRTVRVYVVGDVQSPGAYDISSLSTALNALYAAGGPTDRGSLRHLRQYRGKTLVQEIDAYDLLLHGIHHELSRLQAGDTLLVPPLGPQVTVQGMVERPAIYELGNEKSLAEVLELAGGVLSSGSLRHVDVERTLAHESRTMLRLDLPESNDQQAVNLALDQFPVQDGDKIKISPILPYANQTVYLDGHVFHPGKYPYKDGMGITDILHSYSDLMPEASAHAEIIRLEAPDYAPEVLAFPLSEAMAGKSLGLVLRPFDTIRIFSRYDFEDPPIITVTGEVRFPGDHVTNGVTHLRDAIYLAGGAGPDAELQDAQVFRRTGDGKLKVMNVNLAKALTGETADNVLLQPRDRLFIHRNPSKVDPPTVLVQGEVSHPGRYALGAGMTASELVRLAGGLKRSADIGGEAWATYHLSARNMIEASFRHMEVDHSFLEGGHINDFSLESQLRLRAGILVTSRIQYERWAFPLLGPAPQRNLTTSLQITFAPRSSAAEHSLFPRSAPSRAQAAGQGQKP